MRQHTRGGACVLARRGAQVYEHFHGRPGWRVVPGTDDYARDYASSKFCLAAAVRTCRHCLLLDP
jgi:hypothetical protein